MSNFTAHDVLLFEQELYAAAQNAGGFIKPRARRKTGIIGTTVKFPKISAAGAAQAKTRNGEVPLLDIARNRVECSLADYYGADLVDDLDNLKTNVNEKAGVMDAITKSLHRKEDDIALAAMIGGSNANDNTSADDAWTSDATPRSVLEKFGNAEIMDAGGMHAAISWKTWNALLSLNSFINSQYGGDTSLTSEGQAPKMYFGFAYVPFSRLSLHSSGAVYNLWWNQKVVGVAVGAEVTTTMERIPRLDAMQIMGKMSQGACLIDDTGMIKRRYEA